MVPILIELPEEIFTPRLRLKAPQPGDGPILNEGILDSFASLHEWMPWAKEPPTVEESEEHVRRCRSRWIMREDLPLSIYCRDTGLYLGGTGLHRIRWDIPSVEIGYWIRDSHRGRGLVTEATLGLTLFAFQHLQAKRVEIRCDARNEKSAAIPRRLGFPLEGRLRNNILDTEGNPRDTLVFARTEPEGLPALDVHW